MPTLPIIPNGRRSGTTSRKSSRRLALISAVWPRLAAHHQLPACCSKHHGVGYLFNPDTAPLLYARSVETAAPSLSVKPFAAAVHNAAEMERMIKRVAREPNSALLVLPDLFTATYRQLIIEFAARHYLPAVYPFRYFVAGGGLMSYGTEMLETYRQAASYVESHSQG